MLNVQEVFEKFEEIGCCAFATLDGCGGIDSRIAHFFAWDEEGLYLRTMASKPFYRQLVEGAQLTISDACIACGRCAEVCTHKAIVPGDPYRILGERCDECGNCYHVCPAGAVEAKGV